MVGYPAPRAGQHAGRAVAGGAKAAASERAYNVAEMDAEGKGGARGNRNELG